MQTPPKADPPEMQTPRIRQRAGGTHPTGMHTCFNIRLSSTIGLQCTHFKRYKNTHVDGMCELGMRIDSCQAKANAKANANVFRSHWKTKTDLQEASLNFRFKPCGNKTKNKLPKLPKMLINRIMDGTCLWWCSNRTWSAFVKSDPFTWFSVPLVVRFCLQYG